MSEQILVIGAGPAGMMAAGIAAKNGKNVVLIEKNKIPGKKLYITGKGRCNLTNIIDIDKFFDYIPVNPKFLYSALYSFDNIQLINFFKNLGLETKVERGGRVFPVTDKSKDVVKTLEKFLKMNNVKIIQGEVIKILTKDKYIDGVQFKNGQVKRCKRVVLATGGASYPQTGSTGDGYRFTRQLGHTISRIKPSLVPLETEENWVKKTNNLKLKNIKISLFKNGKEIYNDFGELTFEEYGISGPVVLSASSHIEDPLKDKYKLKIDLKPALSFDKLDSRIIRDFKKYSRKDFSNSLNDILPVKLIPVILKLSSIPFNKKVNQITQKERYHLIKLLKNMSLTIKNFRPISEAIITSGGVNVDEVDPGTMASRLIKNLYFAGEILDVEGYTGGFNLQISFSTGYLAGLNC